METVGPFTSDARLLLYSLRKKRVTTKTNTTDIAGEINTDIPARGEGTVGTASSQTEEGVGINTACVGMRPLT
jgi:hypothetical protein